MIHEEVPTVTDTDKHVPCTKVAAPIEANLPRNKPILLLRMLTIQPARCMSSTMMFGNRRSRHPCSRVTYEAVPLSLRREVISVTLHRPTPLETRGTIGSVQLSVAWTFRRIWNKEELFNRLLINIKSWLYNIRTKESSMPDSANKRCKYIRSEFV